MNENNFKKENDKDYKITEKNGFYEKFIKQFFDKHNIKIHF